MALGLGERATVDGDALLDLSSRLATAYFSAINTCRSCRPNCAASAATFLVSVARHIAERCGDLPHSWTSWQHAADPPRLAGGVVLVLVGDA